MVEVVGESFNEHEVVLVSCAGSEDYAAAEEANYMSPDGHAIGRDPDPLIDAMRLRRRGPVHS